MRRCQARPANRQAAIRLFYFAAVLLLALWLGDLFLGSLFYLRSQGLVTAEPAVIAAEFSAITLTRMCSFPGVTTGGHPSIGRNMTLVNSTGL